jgi:hypothetical protein
MEIAFVHTGESHDRIHISRDDGSEASWRWGAGGPAHDLIHWVVEDALLLERGFWGLVAAGADFGFVNARGHAGERCEGELGDTSELMQAEAVVNSIQQGIAIEPRWSDAECLRWAATWCEQAGVELPEGLDVALYGQIRADAERWVARFRELEPGEALDVRWR